MSMKDQGNAAFKAKDFDKAVEHYSAALLESGNDHTILGNRAAAYHNMSKF